MVISLRISGRRRRYQPPPPPPAGDYAAAAPHAAASLEGPPLPPRPLWEAAGSWIDSGNAAPLDLPERNDVDPVEPDLEPSFALNLFLDGYSIGEPDKGMPTYLIGDDPKKRPFSRASKALFSVRDYRLLSNGGDYSGDDFRKVNRISLRLGIECVVKDLSSIVDASWTYHDQLSVVLSALQPRLNLDPTSCSEMICSSKKTDLGLDKGRQEAKDESLYISVNTLGNCKPDEFNVCKSRTVCVEGEAVEGVQSGKLNSALVNCPSKNLINNAKLPAEPDPNNTIQSCTLKNNSALCDSKGSASSTASEHSVQGNELQAKVAALQVDSKHGQPQIGTVIPSKRKKCINLVHESKRSCPNKTPILNSQHSKVIEKSTGSSNTERLDLGSPKVMVDQIIGDMDMKVKQERCEVPVVNLPNSASEDLKEKRTFSMTSFNGSSREAAFKPHECKARTGPKHSAIKGNVLGMSTITLKHEQVQKEKAEKC